MSFSIGLVSLVMAALALIVASAAFYFAVRAKVTAEMLEKAPVLRQYVERYVPYDNSEESQRRMREKMEEASKAFEDSVWPGKVKTEKQKRNEVNTLRPEDLV